MLDTPKMKIVIGRYPPNFDKIKAVFPDVENYPLVMCYGDTIYNKRNIALTDDQIYHESIHALRQGNDPEGYCDRFLNDHVFRIECEAEAYAGQLKFIEEKRRGKFPGLIKRLASFLSGPAYGSVVSAEEAEAKIRSYYEKL